MFMLDSLPSTRTLRGHRSALVLVLLALASAGGAAADDRDLLRDSSSDPFVFIIFDTSGSMNWATKCTQDQYDRGECNFVCPEGDCFVPQNGDDPNSKFYQAKSALFEVIEQNPTIRYGFATFNQDDLQVRHKHWLYSAREAKPDGSANGLLLASGRRFPAAGAEEVFGPTWTCDEYSGDPSRAEDKFKEAGCNGSSALITSMDDAVGLARVHRLPKIGEPRGTYADRFDAQSFANDDGDLSWSGRWTVLDAVDADPDAGEVRVDGGELRMQDLNSSANGPAVIREVDLRPWNHLVRPTASDPSGWNRLFAPPVELSFDYRTEDATASDVMLVAYCHPDVSTCDNACTIASTKWTKIGEITGALRQGRKSYQLDQVPLSNTPIANSLKVCIRKSSNFSKTSTRSPYLYVDNVEITSAVTVYLEDELSSPDVRYKFVYRPVGSLPDGTTNVYGNEPFAAEVEAFQCTSDVKRCENEVFARDLVYYNWPTSRFSEKIGEDATGKALWSTTERKVRPEFVSWDLQPRTTSPQNGFFSQSRAGDTSTSDSASCNGWDPNDDTSVDPFLGDPDLNLRYPTDPASLVPVWDLDGDGTKETANPRGDVLPFDWRYAQTSDVLRRLAPNYGGAEDPDFAVARYLEDGRVAPELGLRLGNTIQRPMFADGATPLGNTIKSFRTWYTGCASGSCPHDSGWADIAARFDPDFNCRKKFLLVLTDGDESCGGGASACSGTAALRSQTGIRTWVVAFGVPNGGGNTLNCMSSNGGTGDPIYPQNKAELIETLQDIFGQIKVAARSFAAASVPTVQNETSDKIYISNFTPLPDNDPVKAPTPATWIGEINAFRKPLPLTVDDKPDVTRKCNDSANGIVRQSGCHLWDAGELLLAQAPTPAEAASGVYKLGRLLSERRVLYSKARTTEAVPSSMRLLLPPRPPDSNGAPTANERDLWAGFAIPYTVGDRTSEQTARDLAVDIIGHTLMKKMATIPDPDMPDQDIDVEYVLGDIFHADPQVTGSPNNLIYFRQDLHGYQDFSNRYFWRRKMLVVAANDGQLHFFDAGIRTEVLDPSSGQVVERFTDGTGKELFSYVPRLVMPAVSHQARSTRHVYTLDGNSSIDDVWIDPRHDGTNYSAADRGWRTVLISGLREGGDILKEAGVPLGFVSGYFALDITEPDVLVDPDVSDPDNPPIPMPVGSVLPSCLKVGTNDGSHDTSSECLTPAGTANVFPAELWTFTDQVRRTPASTVAYDLDEEDLDADSLADGNGLRDLGDTWSRPIIGRIRVCKPGGASCEPTVGTDLEDRYVAIFGGGIDPTRPNSDQRGAWAYMVDVETGRALYKRQLDGGVAADPAVLDVDRDGYFDVVYLVTTTGSLYKIDLAALDASGEVPGFADVRIDNRRLVGSPLAAGDSFTVPRIVDDAWKPLKIFDTEGKPLYQTPTAFVVPEIDQYALAFGSGNRHNLWDFDGTPARFYTIVDRDFTATSLPTPLRESDFRANNAVFSFLDPDADVSFLSQAPHGWIMELGVDEKVINQAFVVVGVMIFSSFSPQEDLSDELNETPCARSGLSRIFVVDAENGDAFTDLDNETTDIERYLAVGDFTTSPYVDQTATKNPGDAASGERTTESVLDERQQTLQEAIRQSLMRFFPSGCRFNKSYSLTINASRSDTGHVRYATIPIAMCPVDWREE